MVYEDILYNYALKVFGYTRRLKRNLAINDALRFADILSKSNHSTKADKHKVWAQEIVTMLNYIYPENPDVLYVAGSVLTSVGNYQGRNIIKSDFNGADAMEKIYLELKKDSNLQREHLLPSEKAFAYKMKLEALKHQGKTYGQVVHKSRDNISDNESGRQVQRYIRLTHLIPELLKLVDEERIAFTPAVELSYLPENEQKMLAEEIEYTDATPSLSQAQRLRKFSEQGRLSIDTIFAVLSEEKPNQKEQVKFKTEDIRKYFPKSYTSLDMQKTIISLLEKWQRQRERNRGEAR